MKGIIFSVLEKSITVCGDNCWLDIYPGSPWLTLEL